MHNHSPCHTHTYHTHPNSPGHKHIEDAVNEKHPEHPPHAKRVISSDRICRIVPPQTATTLFQTSYDLHTEP